MYLALVALLATGGAPSPAQRQQAAGALYQIFLYIQAQGSFTFDRSRGLPVHQDEIGVDFSFGSAVAVSSDGYLVTARHVADIEDAVTSFCKEAKRRWREVRVDRIKLVMTANDIVGGHWPAEFIITSQEVSEHDVCGGPVKVETDPIWPLRLVRSDTMADLALLKLDVQDGPISYVPWGSSGELEAGHQVYALGYIDRTHFEVSDGRVVSTCEIEKSPVSRSGELVVLKSFEVMRLLIEVKPGMSGGPVISSDGLVGISRSIGTTADENPIAMIVPGDYIRKWFLWVTGASLIRPNKVCEEPGMR